MRKCWCSNSTYQSFGPDYGRCTACGTLISHNSLSDDQLIVREDEKDFYGKQYWLKHQSEDLEYPDIKARARSDLTERNLHWLKIFLKYSLPPARVLELGCAHGSFVALLRQAGFKATGVEMSPWVVEFGRSTFSVPVGLGPLENLDIALGSLDAIALMDVLEHLPDPLGTMAHCLRLLKPDGMLLVQTPQFREDMEYESLQSNREPFLDQLKADEHIYLFTEDSVAALFRQLGAPNIQYEPAIFSHYDMFFAVGRQPFRKHDVLEQENALRRSANGWMVQGLLDLRARELEIMELLRESEADRAARLELIHELSKKLKMNSWWKG